MGVVIRRAALADALELSQLICNNAQVAFKTFYSPLQMQIFLRYYDVASVRHNIERQEIFCAVDQQSILGCVGLDADSVVGFYTRLDQRGRGIGRMLMQSLHQHAQSKGLSQLLLYASPAAVSFYVQLGYRIDKLLNVQYLGVDFEETLMRFELPKI